MMLKHQTLPTLRFPPFIILFDLTIMVDHIVHRIDILNFNPGTYGGSPTGKYISTSRTVKRNINAIKI